MKKYRENDIIKYYNYKIANLDSLINPKTLPQYNSLYLEQALENIISNNIDIDTAQDYFSDICELVSLYIDYNDTWLTDDYFEYVELLYLNDILDNLKDDADFESYLNDIKVHNAEKNKHFFDRNLSNFEKIHYMNYFEQKCHDSIDFNKDFYNRNLEDLMKQRNLEAITIYAYMFYGNCGEDFGYHEDYKKCEELLLSIIDNLPDVDKPTVANTLGYIYYYGRVNNGIGEYEKAFNFFSLAHACGVYEATYKLSDMYLKGKGVIKSELAAYHLVNRLYGELEYRFYYKHEITNFPDILIRMANFYKNGIYVNQNKYLAFEYFLMAKYTLELRMKESNFFGNYSLENRINKDILELKEELDIITNPHKINLDYCYSSIVEFMDSPLLVNLKPLKSEYKLTFTRTDKIKKFITFRGYDKILFTDTITIYIKKGDNVILINNDEPNNVVIPSFDFTEFFNLDKELILSANIFDGYLKF